MRPTLPVALLACLLVLGGCSAPVADGGTATDGPPTDATVPATTSTGDVDTTTSTGDVGTTTSPADRNGSAGDGQMGRVYGVDADLTADRVERLLGVTIDHPRVVVSGERIDETESQYGRSLSGDAFLAAFDLAPEGDRDVRIAGYVETGREVVMSPDLGERGAESTLAHELVHVVQRQKGWQPAWNGTTLAAYWGTGGREVRYVWRLVTEGTAQYVGYAYAAAHLDAPSVDNRLSVLERRYEDWAGAQRLLWAPYYHGLTYVHDRIGNTTEVGEIYGSTPLTTEQVLHGETPATEPPVPLSVDVEAPDDRRRGPQGELFTRIALRQELPADTAREAAAGWGNDTLLAVGTGNASGHVWVTRWDTPEDAAEFADGVETFDALRVGSTTVYDARRPGSDVVVVTVGPPTLADRTSVAADGAAVTVAVAPGTD